MIEWFMFGALGFFLGCLLGLMLAPPLWNRAVKLTTRRLEATMPMTLAEIQADKDQIRADFALQLRKVEVALDKSKEKAARELIEANKRRVEIHKLNGSLEAAKGELHEAENANRVLQQTIKRRLPDLDARLKAAKKALTDLEAVNAELRTTIASQSDALKVARATVHNQRADIDQLRLSLESGGASGRGSSKNNSKAVAESQRLTAELSRAQEELERVRTSSEEIEFLRRELNQLASHILDAARQQPPAWQSAMTGQAASAEESEPLAEPQHAMAMANETADLHEEAAYAGNGAAEPSELVQDQAYAAGEEQAYTAADDRAAYAEESIAGSGESQDAGVSTADPHVEESYHAEETPSADVDYAGESREVEPPRWEEKQVATHTFDAETYNGEGDDETEEDFENYEIQGHYASRGQDDSDQSDEIEEHDTEPHHDDEETADEDVNQAEEKSRSLSSRFAARRAKRQARKSGGGSLTSRLRGLVADSPETRG
jgi:hypothetical protein